MSLNFKAIFKVLSSIMILLSISMIPPLIISITNGETDSAKGFIATIVLLAFCGGLCYRFLQPMDKTLKIRDGLLIVALSWVLATVFGAFPFVISGTIPQISDALFESASGFTTTGVSILTDVEALPRGIKFWRSFTQWLGGMGILLFAIALLPALGISGQRIAHAELTGPTKDKISAKMSNAAKILYMIYIGISLVITVLLILGGMSFFDALIHAFAAVSTAGFSTYNKSVQHFDSAYIEIVLATAMIVCGINFNLLYILLRGKIKQFFQDSELKFYLAVLASSVLIITLNLRISGWSQSIGDAFTTAYFQVASILTTTGFSTGDFVTWPSFCIIVLFALMFCGACSSSTTGSIKCVRVLVMFKQLKRSALRRLHPRAVIPLKLNQKVLPDDVVFGISGFVFMYFLLFLLGALVLSLDGADVLTAFNASAATLGNVGVDFGMMGPGGNYAFFSPWCKIFLSFFMIVGRLELYTILLLFMPSFWNPDK